MNTRDENRTPGAVIGAVVIAMAIYFAWIVIEMASMGHSAKRAAELFGALAVAIVAAAGGRFLGGTGRQRRQR